MNSPVARSSLESRGQMLNLIALGRDDCSRKTCWVERGDHVEPLVGSCHSHLLIISPDAGETIATAYSANFASTGNGVMNDW